MKCAPKHNAYASCYKSPRPPGTPGFRPTRIEPHDTCTNPQPTPLHSTPKPATWAHDRGTKRPLAHAHVHAGPRTACTKNRKPHPCVKDPYSLSPESCPLFLPDFALCLAEAPPPPMSIYFFTGPSLPSDDLLLRFRWPRAGVSVAGLWEHVLVVCWASLGSGAHDGFATRGDEAGGLCG